MGKSMAGNQIALGDLEDVLGQLMASKMAILVPS